MISSTYPMIGILVLDYFYISIHTWIFSVEEYYNGRILYSNNVNYFWNRWLTTLCRSFVDIYVHTSFIPQICLKKNETFYWIFLPCKHIIPIYVLRYVEAFLKILIVVLLPTSFTKYLCTYIGMCVSVLARLFSNFVTIFFRTWHKKLYKFDIWNICIYVNIYQISNSILHFPSGFKDQLQNVVNHQVFD